MPGLPMCSNAPPPYFHPQRYQPSKKTAPAAPSAKAGERGSSSNQHLLL